MRDEDIVYDEDTGPPMTDEFTEQTMQEPATLISNGLEDFQRNIKVAQQILQEQEKATSGNR